MKSAISSLLIASLLSPMAHSQTRLSQESDKDYSIKINPLTSEVAQSIELKAKMMKEEAVNLAAYTYHMALYAALLDAKNAQTDTKLFQVNVSALAVASLGSLYIAMHLANGTPDAVIRASKNSIVESQAILAKLETKSSELSSKLNQTDLLRRTILIENGLPVTKEYLQSFDGSEARYSAAWTKVDINQLQKQIRSESRRMNMQKAIAGVKTIALRSLGVGASATTAYLFGYEVLLKGYFLMTEQELNAALINVSEKIEADRENSILLKTLK